MLLLDGISPLVIGTLLTGVSNLLFALINPAATYWAFGFPAAILTVFGADFVFATGTLFTAKVCLPHEQSLGGAVFQTVTQIGTAFGLAISTVVFNTQIAKAGGSDPSGADVSRDDQLVAYKDAMWTGFAFGAFGEYKCRVMEADEELNAAVMCVGALIAFLFLRGVGIVGHRKEPSPPRDSESNTTVNEEEKR